MESNKFDKQIREKIKNLKAEYKPEDWKLMEQKLGIGVIGAGRIGMLHAQNLTRRIPGSRVVAVADRRVACARAAAASAAAPP